MNDGFAFFIVFRKRPGGYALHITSAKAGPAISVKHVTRSWFVKDRPNFKAFAQFPTSAVENCAAPRQAGRLALILGSRRQKIDGLLAGYFQPDRFERRVH